MDFTEIIQSKVVVARNILANDGPEEAMGYLIGDKFLTFLALAENDREWRQAVPTFVTEIKSIFEPRQLAAYLNTPHPLRALIHAASAKADWAFQEEMDEEQQIQDGAKNLPLERARELLLYEKS